MKRVLLALCCAAFAAAASPASAQSVGGNLASDPDVPRCVKLCVALLQAIGDEVKEQIFLNCDQISGSCSGDGHLSLTDERVPVSVNSTLEGDALNLRIVGPKGSFGTEDGDQLSMELGPDMPWQVGQFVVQPMSDGQPSGERPLVVTILVEKLMDDVEPQPTAQ
jgi:hypothetical protein